MARFCPLFSSSGGNCIAVGGADSYILIDAGVSAKQIRLSLDRRGFDISRLRAVFITHEHIDHVNGLRVLASRQELPVYATAGTLQKLAAQGHLDGVAKTEVCPGEGMEIAGMRVTPFRTMHDVAESCGYTVETADGRRIAIATDTGCVTEDMREALTGSDLVYIEANHDIGMLMNGSYSYPLKQRILSPKGHLSNDACAAELPYFVQNGSTRFILAHLSRENNSPELAEKAALAMFSSMKMKRDRDYTIQVAAPDGLSATVF